MTEITYRIDQDSVLVVIDNGITQSEWKTTNGLVEHMTVPDQLRWLARTIEKQEMQ